MFDVEFLKFLIWFDKGFVCKILAHDFLRISVRESFFAQVHCH